MKFEAKELKKVGGRTFSSRNLTLELEKSC
ncbi:hypothetical protein NC652_003565 [Populus alba x Populus x berolinensis]|nr:hypothetical protein NC652_003565 [Populus alba x Populus x berolinensis]